MTPFAWRKLIVDAALSDDNEQLYAIAARLAAADRLAGALQAHGHLLNGQPIDVVVCRALNMEVEE